MKGSTGGLPSNPCMDGIMGLSTSSGASMGRYRSHGCVSAGEASLNGPFDGMRRPFLYLRTETFAEARRAAFSKRLAPTSQDSASDECVEYVRCACESPHPLSDFALCENMAASANPICPPRLLHHKV